MSFMDAVKTCFSKYVDFSGRARRSEYWWFVLFANIVIWVAMIVFPIIRVAWLAFIVELALILPALAVSIRRLHDTGRSGWWLLIALIPLIGAIVLLVFAVQDSQPGQNAYGANPKGVAPATAAAA